MASPPPSGAPYVDPNQQYPYQQLPPGQADPYQQQQPPAQYGQSPQPGYPPQQPGYPQAAPGLVPPPVAGAPQAGRGKRRGYAEQQYDFGQGANSALTPTAGGGPYQGGPGGPGYPGAQPVAGYPQDPAQQQQQQQQQFIQPMGVQQPSYPGVASPSTLGGYDPTGGVAGVTQQFGQMGMGGAPATQQTPQMMPQPQGMQKAQGLNPLITVDLMHQPFNVAELDLPPPEIILPPNVRFLSLCAVVRRPSGRS
jgi:protein transport protein SEC24